MGGFIEGLGRHTEERMADSAHNYSVKCVKMLCKAHGLTIDANTREPDFGFTWFHDEYSSYPVFLEARQCSFEWADIVGRVTKTKVWQELLTLIQTCGRQKSKHGLPIVGIMVQANRFGMWVAHNACFLEQQPGFPRVIHQARTKEWAVVFDPLEGFAAAVKAGGWTA